MAALFAAGDLDRGGAGVAGVVVGVGEAGDVAGVGEDLGGQDSLMPKISVSELPEAATASAQRRRLSLRARSMRRTSASSWRAIVLRSMSTTPAGLIVASRRDARSAESCRGAPPGCRSRSRRCSRLTARRRSAVSSSRRSESSRRTALWSSGGDPREVVAVLGDEGDAASVDAVALASVAALEHAGAGGQRRRDVDDGLAGARRAAGPAVARDRRRPRSPRRAAASQPPMLEALSSVELSARHAQLARAVRPSRRARRRCGSSCGGRCRS